MNYKRKGHRGRSKKAPMRTQGAGRASGNSAGKAKWGRFSRQIGTGKALYHQAKAERNRMEADEL